MVRIKCLVATFGLVVISIHAATIPVLADQLNISEDDTLFRQSLGKVSSSSSIATTVKQTYDDHQYSVKGRHVDHRFTPTVFFSYTERSTLSLNDTSKYGLNMYDPLAVFGANWPQGQEVGCNPQDQSKSEGHWQNLVAKPNNTVVLAGIDNNQPTSPPFRDFDNHIYETGSPFSCFFGGGSVILPSQYITGFVNPGNYLNHPVIEWQLFAGDTILHLVAAESSFDTASGTSSVSEVVIQYFQKRGGMSGTWSGPITMDTANYMAEITASRSTGRVAVIYPHHTADAYIHDQDRDNDVYYRESVDGGIIWGTPVNITQNLRTLPSYSPLIEVHGLYDTDDFLHIVWNGVSLPADPYGQADDVFATSSSSLFHWSNRSALIRRVHNAEYTNLEESLICGFGGANALSVGYFSISECNNRLYLLFSQWNDWKNGIFDDCSLSGVKTYRGNGDLFVSVSSSKDGILWDAARNLTNTYTPGCSIPGQPFVVCMNETKSSMAAYGMDETAYGQTLDWTGLNNIWDPSGGYTGNHFLHLTYLEDHLPGDRSQSLEGFPTLNDLNWARLACVDPVIAPRFSTWSSLSLCPCSINHGDEDLVTVTVTNDGNANLNISQIGTVQNSGPGSWLSVSPTSLSIPIGTSSTFDVHINQDLAINSPGTLVPLQGEIFLLSNDPEHDSTSLAIDYAVGAINTQSGSNIVVMPSTDVTITFDSVSSEGITVV